jgi:hypothetical protein
MSAPRLLSDGLAVIMLAIAAYCAIRPLAARRWRRTTERDTDAAHVLMGVAMAAVLVPRLDPLQAGVWAVALAAACVWFAARALRDRSSGHHLIHLLSCGSMLYMLLAASSAAASAPAMAVSARPAAGASLAATGSAISPLVALVLAAAMACSVVVTTDRLAILVPARHGRPPGTVQPPGTGRSPEREGSESVGESAALDLSPRSGRAVLCPRLATCCQIVMGVTMVYTLVLML